ncbi:MAG TPA: hypothetical protein VMU14_25000, partial [Acidimicrobiales bacterium]|nr:hypothetical protein [Acidimicrobiales bacterium]
VVSPLSVQHSAETWNDATLMVLGMVKEAVQDPSAHACPLLLTFVLTFVPPKRVFGVKPMMTFCPPAGHGVTDLMLTTVPGPPVVGVTDIVADAGGAGFAPAQGTATRHNESRPAANITPTRRQ